jgi:two-component system NarL family sensor kinase
MRRYLLTGLYILCMTLPSYAQLLQSYTDSIRTYLQSTKPDTGKTYLLLRLAQLPECPPDTLVAYGQHWYAYALKHKISTGVPEALYTTGLGWFRKGQNTEALDYLYKSAMAWEKSGQNPLQLARTYELIATLYKMLEKFPDALSYYRLACVIKKTQHNEVILLSTYNSLGNTFRALNQMDSAIWYLKKALPLAAGNPLTKAQVSNNLGNIYWSLKNWSQANEWYKEGLHNFESLHHAVGIAEANFNLGAVATQLEQYPEAIVYYNNSLQAVSDGQSIEHQEWIYQHLGDAYFKTGHFEQAYNNAVKYATIKDSTLSLNIQKSIADLKEKYETEKKEHALALEQARTTKLSLINTNQMRLIYVLAGVAIIISIMGYFMISNMRRKQILAAELADLKEKEKQQMIQEQALRNNIAMLEGQEAERQRIARDLHDRLGSTLTSVRRFMQSPDHSGKIDVMLDEAIDDVRRISHDLSDGVLQKYGLAEALEDLKDTTAAGGIMNITLHQGDFGTLPASIAAEIYYITRELVNNAVKHSKASQLSITLMREEQLLYLTVEDDGKGFDTTAVNRGIGLANIETRAFKINAQFTIESYPGKGTCIFFTIPLS